MTTMLSTIIMIIIIKEQSQNDCQETIIKVITPINHNGSKTPWKKQNKTNKKHPEFLVITRNLLKVREILRAQGAIAF